MAKSKFQYILYYYYIITHSSNLEITMSFPTEFAADFSSFRIDPEPNKYLSNTSNSPLSMWQDEFASNFPLSA